MDVSSYLLGKNAGGGGGGTTDYQALSNKPSINGVTLSGNKTTSDLGIETEPIYLGDVTDFANPDYLELNGLKKGYYMISCNTFNPSIRLKVKNGENEFFAYASFSSITAADRLKDNVIYLYVENEIPEQFDSTINFGKFSFESCNETSYYIHFRKMNISIGTSQINVTNSMSSFNLLLTDKAQTVSGKKTFTTLPESSVVPTTDDQLVNKKYVDDNAGGGDNSFHLITDNSQSNPLVLEDLEPGLYYFTNLSNNKLYMKGTATGTVDYFTMKDNEGIFIPKKYSEVNIGQPFGFSTTYYIGSNANYFLALFSDTIAKINAAGDFGRSSYPIMDFYYFLQRISGYDGTKTQVLKNVNGALTWINE